MTTIKQLLKKVKKFCDNQKDCGNCEYINSDICPKDELMRLLNYFEKYKG